MALHLSERFDRVIGLDPSKKMVDVGLSSPRNNITYAVGDAEHTHLPDQSTDLVIAGQAAHWFNHVETWAELRRILRPKGTVAYVVSRGATSAASEERADARQGYGELRFPDRPELSALITQHQSGTGGIGPYWSQPGRAIVEGLLNKVPFPIRPETDVTFVDKLPDLTGRGHPEADRIDEPEPVNIEGFDSTSAVRLKAGDAGTWYLRKTWGLDHLAGYLRSASALHAYHEAHPEDKAREGNGENGDIVDRLIFNVAKGLGDGKEIEVAWPLVLMMIRRA